MFTFIFISLSLKMKINQIDSFFFYFHQSGKVRCRRVRSYIRREIVIIISFQSVFCSQRKSRIDMSFEPSSLCSHRSKHQISFH